MSEVQRETAIDLELPGGGIHWQSGLDLQELGERGRGLIGIVAILALAYAPSENRRAIARRVLFWGLTRLPVPPTRSHPPVSNSSHGDRTIPELE